MVDDIRTGWRVVLETHSGHQLNEESVATLPELGVLVDKNPAGAILKQTSDLSGTTTWLGCFTVIH